MLGLHASDYSLIPRTIFVPLSPIARENYVCTLKEMAESQELFLRLWENPLVEQRGPVGNRQIKVRKIKSDEFLIFSWRERVLWTL